MYIVTQRASSKGLSHQVGHDDGAVSVFTRRWVAPLSAFQDLKENQLMRNPRVP